MTQWSIQEGSYELVYHFSLVGRLGLPVRVVSVDQKWFHWLTNRAESNASPHMRAIAAVDPNGLIHGMVGFDGWTKNSVVITIALENPASLRSLIHPLFDYAFNQSGRGVALATVRGSNARSIKLCKRVGMREVYRVKDGIDVGEDLVIFEMRREECRWLQTRRAA